MVGWKWVGWKIEPTNESVMCAIERYTSIHIIIARALFCQTLHPQPLHKHTHTHVQIRGQQWPFSSSNRETAERETESASDGAAWKIRSLFVPGGSVGGSCDCLESRKDSTRNSGACWAAPALCCRFGSARVCLHTLCFL